MASGAISVSLMKPNFNSSFSGSPANAETENKLAPKATVCTVRLMAVESFIIFPFGRVVIKIANLPVSSFVPTMRFLFVSYIFLSFHALSSIFALS
jgi:hypothetical protein